jgi:hypothetical protein
MLLVLILVVLRMKGYLGGNDLEDKGKINLIKNICIESTDQPLFDG